MVYDLLKLPMQTLLRPLADATAALVRLDERIAASPLGEGFLERSHCADACASLWVDGELVHLEDLVLHDAGADIRTPTHELTIARDVLRIRRRIASHPPGWALSLEGVRSLRGQGLSVSHTVADTGVGAGRMTKVEVNGGALDGEGIWAKDGDNVPDPLAQELADIEAVLARSEKAMTLAKMPNRGLNTELQPPKDPLVYDLDWDEDERLDQWRTVVSDTQDLPPVLRAVLVLEAWNPLEVLQHAPWLGRLLAAELLRDGRLTTGAHLTALNLGLKSIPRERRSHRHRETRLLALLEGIAAAAGLGLKEHDRLTLARQMMEHRLTGRRQSSKLPKLIDLVLSRPMVSTGMIAKEIGVTPRAALRIVEELNLRELTGRGRFRAWGVT
jgi:hypothetical protein